MQDFSKEFPVKKLLPGNIHNKRWTTHMFPRAIKRSSTHVVSSKSERPNDLRVLMILVVCFQT